MDRHVLLLWKYKWLILLVAIVAGVLTYVGLLFVPETYRVKSEIFVNRLPAAADEETPNPETVTSLLKSQAVFEDVKNDFVRAFPERGTPKIEDFAKQFTVKSTILQDTTVLKQFSPVLSLQVDAKGSSETRFIMESWIRNFIREFGNYTTLEAVNKRDAYLKEKQRLETDIAKVERERAEYDAKLPYLKRTLAEKLELLTPSRLQFQDQDVDTIKLDFSIQNPRMRPGLLERQTELMIQMQAGDAPATASAELAAIGSAIEDARTSITEAEKTLAEARDAQLRTARHLSQLQANQAAVNDAVSRFTVAAAVFKTSSISGLPAGGDIRALSMPVLPETRVWPKRTLTAGIAAILGALLTIGWIYARNFLTKLSASDTQ